VPILVVCGPDIDCARDYRTAGAAECIASPVDVVALNEMLQQIVRGNGQTAAAPAREAAAFNFAGVRFQPHQNILCAGNSVKVHLTSAEGRLLTHFATNPWEIQSRRLSPRRFTARIAPRPTGPST